MNYNVSKFGAKHNGRPMLFFLLFIIPLLFLSVLTASGQTEAVNEKITLNQSQGTMLDVIREIDRQSAFTFSYSQAQLETINVASLSLNKVSLSEALKVLETKYEMQFSVQQSIVSVKPPEQKSKIRPNIPNVPAGQSSPGTIKGRIVEFETSQPIPGASIRIIELNKGMSSDNEGYYNFSNIPPGKYRLQVSFIGFNIENQHVESKSGKEETYNIKMQGSNLLSEVVVSAVGKTRRPVAHTSEKQLIAEIKNMSVVASGISSQQISMSADRNAAQAITKVSGVSIVDDKFVIVRGLNPRYNLTYLNDNVAPSTEVYSRAFALDLIPSRIIDRIMVYKSAGPETLADATGGVVKIYTKDAKTIKHFDIELQVGHRQNTTFNKNFLTYAGGKTDFLGFDDGTRRLPSSVPDYNQLNIAKLSPSEYANTFSRTLTYQRKTALPNMQLTANYYNSLKVWGKSLSTLTSLSYKNESLKADIFRQQGNEQVSISTTDVINQEDRNNSTAQLNLLQNFTLHLRDSSTITFKNFILQQGQSSTIVRHSRPTVAVPYAVANKDNILSYTQRFLYAGNIGGTHFYKRGHQLQWNGGYTYSRQGTPDLRVIRLTAPTTYLAIGDTTLQWRARGQYRKSDDHINPIPMKLGIISRLWMQNSEGNYNASVDYTYVFKPWLSVRVGTFQQWKERRLFRRVYTVHEGDVTNPDNIFFQPGTGASFIDPQLVRFREQDLKNVWSEEYLQDNYSGLRVYDRTLGSDSYMGSEQNNSGYFALHLTPFNRIFEIYGGVRYEYNRQRIGAAIPKKELTDINLPIFVDNPMRTWLPSVNASWRPSQNLVLRGAYGKTVNRTEFREVSPFTELDYENNLEIQGNVMLKSAVINNYDFRIEFYPKGNNQGETISAGVFFKSLKDPIERINTSNRVNSLFPQVSYQNAQSANIKGLEVELRKKLDFIPGKLFRDFSVIANASFIKSETRIDTTDFNQGTTDRRPLQGQSPYIINAGLYYDNAALGTRISAVFNTTGLNIYAVGRNTKSSSFVIGPEYRGSLMELPRHLLDVAVTQRIGKGLQAKFSVQNILNSAVTVVEDFNATNKYEPLKQLTVPPSTSDDTWRETGDNISSKHQPGRYVVLSLSYSL